MSDYAVNVRNACKSYGSKSVLLDLNMTVNRGTIYGLLGASGCGKTTLLSCIVGRKQLDSGTVWTLGGKPGTKESGVPGTRVGYMPQELALVAEFSVKDAVHYFGRILNLPDDTIQRRFEELTNLLDLPPHDRLIKNCSGGQQRRISFAAAMVHEPELLILDEPTVGLDPVLRDSIWHHLVEITEKRDTAVIITTHYIEEARQAHKIGLMREGRLLAEESPERLLMLFRTDTLEEVFLILSKQQEEGRLRDIGDVADDQNNTDIGRANSDMSMAMTEVGHGSTDVLTSSKDRESHKTTSASCLSLNKRRLKALMRKNYLQYFTNAAGISFMIIFPILEMCAFFFAVGDDIKGIQLGIVNDEHSLNFCSHYNRSLTTIPANFTDCDLSDLSCRFLQDVNTTMIKKVYYDDFDEAVDAITHGDIIGVMYFAHNFTQSYQRRLDKITGTDNESIDLSQIKVWLDMSNRQIGATIKYKLLTIFVDFQKSLFADCKLLPQFGDIPLRFHYEYLDRDETYAVFMTPGALLTIMFFMGTILTSTIIITDRAEGVWDRSIVAGVTSLEIMITHFVTQFIMILVQVLEVMVLTFVFFKMQYVGSLTLITFIMTLEGLCGMCYGFWVSVISDNHNMAHIISTGSFYPMILLCGMVWPLEGQPPVLRFLAKCLPFTIPVLSLRNVMVKGWSIENLDVLNGIGVSVLWIIGLSIVSMLLIKRKR